MYEYIKGKVAIKHHDSVVIENGGIGYRIFTSLNTLSQLILDQEAQLNTHLHVRDDAMLLYGFVCKEELYLFHMLISISGIGPKAALSILSIHTFQDVAAAVVSDDVACLTKAPGIGKKTAMRIILELKDKLKGVELEPIKTQSIADDSKYNEAVTALMVLGYSTKDAGQALAKTYDDKDSLQDIIKKALAAKL